MPVACSTVALLTSKPIRIGHPWWLATGVLTGAPCREFWHPGSTCLHCGKDGFDRQRTQTGDVQRWSTDIFLTRLAGQTREYSTMLWRRRHPANTACGSHDRQGRCALTDRNVQGSRVASHQEIGPGQQGCQCIEPPGRDERGARACRCSNGLHLGLLPRPPEQHETSP